MTTQEKSDDAPVKADNIIAVVAGETERMAAESEQTLMRSQAGENIFQRSGQFVRVRRQDEPRKKRLWNTPAGALQIEPLTTAALERLFEASAVFVKQTADGQPRRVGCPPRLAEKYQADVGACKLRVLAGITTAPTLRSDGSVVQSPGYDDATGIYFHPCGVIFPPVPDAPTREVAMAALGRLLELVRTFPFCCEHDRAAWIAAVLTAMVRHVLPTAPMFPISATAAGTGKTLLTEMVSLITSGVPAACMTLAKGTDEELRKALLPLLVGGAQIIVLDNVTEELDSAALASVVTTTKLRSRALGESRMVEVPTNTTILVTGNGLRLVGDLTRRAVPIELDAKCEHPDGRKFDFDPRAVCIERRPELVVDALTVLRAFILAGRPGVESLSAFGSFEDWSSLIRGSLCWLECPDPLTGRERLREADPVAAGLRRLLTSWHAVFGSRGVPAAEVIKVFDRPFTALAADADGGDDAAQDPRAALAEALREMFGTDRPLDAVRLGKGLPAHRGRIVGGLRLTSRTGHGGGMRWTVEQVDQDGQRGAPSAPEHAQQAPGGDVVTSGEVPTLPSQKKGTVGDGQGMEKGSEDARTPHQTSPRHHSAAAALDLGAIEGMLD